MIFFAGLLFALLAGLIVPYYAIELSQYGFILLSVLMFISGISIDFSVLRGLLKSLKPLLFALTWLFFIIPLLQLIFAQQLLSDNSFILGVYFAALSPVAIVAPQFVGGMGGNRELSYLLMVISSILYPLIVFIMLGLFPFFETKMDYIIILKSSFIWVLLPVVFSMFVSWRLPGLGLKIKNHFPYVNAFLLTVLTYMLVGSIGQKVNIHYFNVMEMSLALLLVFFQDFLYTPFIKFFSNRFFTQADSKAIAISLSMKNTAIGAVLLAFYLPRAAIPSCLVFLPHAVLFGYYHWKSKR